ncbi:MAG: hypothetical protein ACXU7H_03065 [Burkholderiaceae bacterium]
MQLFAYLALLFVYICVASLGLLFCLALATSSTKRKIAKKVAGGIIGSFPGVFLFQILSIPLVASAVLLFLSLNQVVGELHGVSQVIYSLIALVFTLGLFAAASVVGFFVGWGVGYRVASGASLRTALKASDILTYPYRLTKTKRSHMSK